MATRRKANHNDPVGTDVVIERTRTHGLDRATRIEQRNRQQVAVRDPLGTKVLFKSLGNLTGLSVRRNYRSSSRLEGNPNSILLYLGVGSEDFQYREKDFFQSLDQYVIQGGRLVITFLPTQRKFSSDEAKTVKQDKKSKTPDPDEDEKERNFVSMEKHWGIVLNYGSSRSKDPDPKKALGLWLRKFLKLRVPQVLCGIPRFFSIV